MTTNRTPYMKARRDARLAAGDKQQSVWMTPQVHADLLRAKRGRSVEQTIAAALRKEAASVA